MSKMRKLFGKIGTGKMQEFIYIFNDTKPDDFKEFRKPDLVNEKEFGSELNLNDDEWFYIRIKAEHLEGMVNGYNLVTKNTTSINQVDRENFGKLSVIFKSVDEDALIFQKITPTKRLNNKKIITIGDVPHAEKITGIDISEKVDAYFDGKDKLYFKSYRTVKSLFTHIEDYYRIATLEDIKKFYEFPACKISVQESDLTDSIRKKIAIIVDNKKLDLSDQAVISKLIDYHENYTKDELYVSSGQFIVQNKKQLDSFCSLVLGRFYENYMTGDIEEALSTKVLPRG